MAPSNMKAVKILAVQQRNAWHLKGFQQRNELKVIHLDRAKEGCLRWARLAHGRTRPDAGTA